MPYEFLYEQLPELAVRETRTLHVFGQDHDYGLLPGEYAFCEMFCNETGCDCRRVFWNVIRDQDFDNPAAVIAWGWETDAFYRAWSREDDPEVTAVLKGPCLNLGSPESAAAPALLDFVVTDLLKDEQYVERVKRHYRLFRNQIEGNDTVIPFPTSTDPVEQRIASAETGTLDHASILFELEKNRGYFPEPALRAAIDRLDELTPHLLHILSKTTDKAEQDEPIDHDDMGHVYAMYLLAQARETKAYPLLIRLAQASSATLDDFLGDVITSGLSRCLASTFDGNLMPLKSLVENAAANEFARGAGLHTMVLLTRSGLLPREELLAYFALLFEDRLERDYSHAWDTLVDLSARTFPGELMEEIKRAFDEGLVDPFYVSYEEIMEWSTKPKVTSITLSNPAETEEPIIRDTVEELHGWHCFSRADQEHEEDNVEAPDGPDMSYTTAFPSSILEPATPHVRSTEKIGRNAPCPCGSGKKYKKCCGQS